MKDLTVEEIKNHLQFEERVFSTLERIAVALESQNLIEAEKLRLYKGTREQLDEEDNTQKRILAALMVIGKMFARNSLSSGIMDCEFFEEAIELINQI